MHFQIFFLNIFKITVDECAKTHGMQEKQASELFRSEITPPLRALRAGESCMLERVDVHAGRALPPHVPTRHLYHIW